MRPNVLFDKVQAGHVVLGLLNMYPASGIIEGMCKGWDYVWIDGQHGQMPFDACLHAVQAAQGIGVETMVRVPGHESGLLGPFADLAPSAVMVPMVNNATEAKAIVDGLRFPPLGRRSYGGRRVIDLDGRDYVDRDLMVVAQIETLEAVDKVDEIIGTDGIDVLFFGPDDMKMRMGIPISTSPFDNEDLQRAMARTARSACAAGKACGTVTGSASAARAAVDMGYRVLVGGADIMFLRVGAANRLTELRDELKQETVPESSPKSGSGVYGG